MAWELGNQLGGWDETVAPGNWTVEMAKHIKKLAPNTLVASGDMGGVNAKSRYTPESLASEYVDIFSNHYYYGESDIKRIIMDSKFISENKKAFMVGEFGLSTIETYEEIYRNIVLTNDISGAMIWSLRYHSRNGGFYVHYEAKGGFYSYHVPGFNGIT